MQDGCAQIRLDFGTHSGHSPAQREPDHSGMSAHPALAAFHPAVGEWFARSYAAPTPAQVGVWPAIASGCDTLVAAPTGIGKTLTASLTAIDALVREGLSHGLPDTTLVLCVLPLKALSNDVHINLEAPLDGIREALTALALPDVDIRTALRTGDHPAGRAGCRWQRWWRANSSRWWPCLAATKPLPGRRCCAIPGGRRSSLPAYRPTRWACIAGGLWPRKRQRRPKAALRAKQPALTWASGRV